MTQEHILVVISKKGCCTWIEEKNEETFQQKKCVHIKTKTKLHASNCQKKRRRKKRGGGGAAQSKTNHKHKKEKKMKQTKSSLHV